MLPLISVLSQQAIIQLMASYPTHSCSKVRFRELLYDTFFFLFQEPHLNVVFIGTQFSSKPLLLIYPVCYKLFLGSMFQITEFKTNGLTRRDYHLKLKSCQNLCCFETLISHLLHLIAILAG